jgi:CRP-like cAMP-binding protein
MSFMSTSREKFGLFRHAQNTIVYPPRTTIFKEGDEGHTMYAIKRGRVEVLVNGKTVDSLGEEEVFGEMALLEHKTRTATVMTLEETELAEIDEAQFYILVRQNPHLALQLMRLLSERLRHAHVLNRVSEP